MVAMVTTRLQAQHGSPRDQEELDVAGRFASD